MKGAGVIVFPVALLLVVVAFFASTYWAPTSPGPVSSSTATTASVIQGIVTGFVTVGPSQPSCPSGQSCDVNMSGYDIVFALQCPGSSNCGSYTAVLSPAGHYSILLSPGNYTVTGLTPSCSWTGCSTAFPRQVQVTGGNQIVLNFEVDTGIR